MDAWELSPAELEAGFRPYLEERAAGKRAAKGSSRAGGGVFVSRGERAARTSMLDRLALMRRWNDLTPEFQTLYAEASAISGNDYDHYYDSPGGRFRIFYSVTGVNSVNLLDTIGYGSGQPSSWRERHSVSNNRPDYVDEAAFAFDSAWAMIVDRFGFEKPVNAPGPDGSAARYSVLITRMSDDGSYGETVSHPPALSPGYASHIEINSYWSAPGIGYDPPPHDYLVRVICAHEFFHASQFAMLWSSFDGIPLGWIEGAATLMEEVAFPEVDDYLQFVPEYFLNPRTSLLTNSRLNSYMNVLLHKYLYERIAPVDTVGFIKDVHFSSMNERIAFGANLERASLAYTGKSWAETLNGFHAESYFTGSRARPWAFVSDAPLMGVWAAPGMDAAESDRRTVPRHSIELFRYTPHSGHPDTLQLAISGETDPGLTGKTWGASLLVMERGSDSVGIVPVPLDMGGRGRAAIPGWKEKSGALLVVTNASHSPISKSVTVSLGNYVADTSEADTMRNSPLTIRPNLVRIREGGARPIRIQGGDIKEIKILTPDGKLLWRWNAGNEVCSLVEWSPDKHKRLVPGTYLILAASVNPDTKKKSVERRKIMVLP